MFFITTNCPCSKVDAATLLPFTVIDLSKLSCAGYLTFLLLFSPSSHAKFPGNVLALSSEGLSGRPLLESRPSPPLHSWRTSPLLLGCRLLGYSLSTPQSLVKCPASSALHSVWWQSFRLFTPVSCLLLVHPGSLLPLDFPLCSFRCF